MKVGGGFGAHTAGDEVLHAGQGCDVSAGVAAMASSVMAGGPDAVAAMPAAQCRGRDTKQSWAGTALMSLSSPIRA